MTVYRDRTFGPEESIELDDNSFISCVFKGCTIFYSGSDHVLLNDCKFDGAKFELRGAAAATLTLLRGLLACKGGEVFVSAVCDMLEAQPASRRDQ